MAQKPMHSLIMIDDDPFFLERLITLFSQDYPCHTAKTGGSGISLYHSLLHSSPLVICDINLPDMSGFEVCKYIKKTNPSTYVIFLSAYNDPQTRLNGCKSLANIQLDKNLSDQEIKLIVRNNYRTLCHYEIDQFDGKIDDLAQQVRALILSHYDIQNTTHRGRSEHLSCEYVAQQLNYSHRTFQRKIKEATDNSFEHFCLLVRLEKAKQLLMLGLTIEAIAEKLDFSTPSHFSHTFKRAFSITPSKYKHSLQTMT